MKIFDCPTQSVLSNCLLKADLFGNFLLESDKIKEIYEHASGSLIAIADYTLTKDDIVWLQKHNSASIVIPRNVQIETRRTGDINPSSLGIGTATEIPIQISDVFHKGRISLEFTFTGLPMFRPRDLQIALLSSDKIEIYQSLPARQLAANHLVMQLGIGFPLFIAAIAIVLDHSVAFAILAVCGLWRAIRSFIPFLLENDGINTAIAEVGFYIFNGLCFAFFLIFISEMCNFLRISKNKIFVLCLLSSFFALVSGYVIPDSWLNLDLYTDILISLIAFVAIGISLKQAITEKKKLTKNSFFEFDGTVLSILSLAILLLAFFIQFWVNIEDLHALTIGGLKNIIDWKHLIVFPLMTSAALFEVGFTSKKVMSVAKEMTEKSIMDHDMEIAQDFQRDIFPRMRQNCEQWSWRCIYKPASKLSGDWFDVRELEFANGEKFLIAAVVDVTGHGVAASLSTMIIATIWSIWCKEVSLQIAPRSEKERIDFLATVPVRLNYALNANRKSGSGTAAFVLFCPRSRVLTYCTAGHPPIVVSDDVSFVKLMTPNPGLGCTEKTDLKSLWSCRNYELKTGEKIFLYSDGLIPIETTASSFLLSLKRKLSQNQKSLSVAFFSRIREAKNFYRENRDTEDDITLVMITPKS